MRDFLDIFLLHKIYLMTYIISKLNNFLLLYLFFRLIQCPPKIFRLSNYSLINFPMVRAASLYCDLNIDLSRTIVGRIFHFSSSNSTQGLVWVYNRTNRVDGPRKIFRWTLYFSFVDTSLAFLIVIYLHVSHLFVPAFCKLQKIRCQIKCQIFTRFNLFVFYVPLASFLNF